MPRNKKNITDKKDAKLKEKDKFKSEFDAEREEEENPDDDGLGFGEAEILDEEKLKKRRKEFEEEAMPHLPLLYNFANKMVGRQAEAEDLVQETFFRAFKYFNKFEKGTNCKAWLFRIMKNLFINDYRKYNKQPGFVDYDEVENFFEIIKSDKLDSSDLQEKVFNNLLDDEVLNALNTMPDDFKTVIILCDLEGLSYEEISEFIQCPVGTVRSRLHRARKMLQQKLYKYAEKRGYDVEANLIH